MKKSVVPLVAVIVLALMLLAAPGLTSGMVNREVLRAWTLPAVAPCGVECYDDSGAECEFEGEPGHRAPPIGNSHETAGGPHWHCVVGMCLWGYMGPGGYVPPKHPVCDDPPFALVEELRDAVRSGDIRMLQRVVRAGPDIEVNHDRRAIQLVGCNETIIAHIPLSERVFNKLNVTD